MGRYTKRERITQLLTDLIAVAFGNCRLFFSRINKLIISNILFCLVSAAFFIVFIFIDPYDRGFYCNDETIRFPLKDDTVPLWVRYFSIQSGLQSAI